MRSLGTLALALSVTVLAGACGIGVVGGAPAGAGAADDAAATQGVDAGDGVDATGVDGGDGVDAQLPPGACTTADTTCTSALAPGWKPIAFASDRSAACPAGYVTADLVTSPAAAGGACTCGCAIAGGGAPSCAKGSFTAAIGSTNTCPTTGQTYTVNGTGCTALAASGSLSAYARYNALPLTPGTCNSTAQKDATKLSTSAVRACEPPPACVEDVCLGSGLGGFASCIAHDGDVACPPGPFAQKTLAGPSATLTCGGCTSCTNTATCGVPVLRFYNDGACATEIASRPANGACNTVTGTAGAFVTHFRYDVTTSSAACTPATNPTTATALDTPRTLCCR